MAPLLIGILEVVQRLLLSLSFLMLPLQSICPTLQLPERLVGSSAKAILFGGTEKPCQLTESESPINFTNLINYGILSIDGIFPSYVVEESVAL
jgi:hypothetical protein